MMTKTFGIAPASAAPWLTILALGILLIILLGFFAFIGYSIRNTTFEVSDQGLRIRGSIYGRFIPKENLVDEEVKIINLNRQKEYQPKLRTNGIGLPGYQSGWFRLKNNERALLFITDRSNVAYIPIRQDYSVLLSVSNTEEFRQSIKQWK